MNILLDECVPLPVKKLLKNHHAKTAVEMGWSSLKNGKLLEASIKEGFDVLLCKPAREGVGDGLSSYRNYFP